jgi:S1-C subfamily serine protease
MRSVRILATAGLFVGTFVVIAGSAYGQERPGWVGVSVDISTMSDGGAPHTVVRIADVQQGSPAARAGLLPGDVLLEVNDLVGPAELQQLASRLHLSVGDTVRLLVQRGAVRQEVRLAAAERPAVVMPPLPRTVAGPEPDSMIASIMRAMDSMRVRLSPAPRVAPTPAVPSPGAPARPPRAPDPDRWIDASGAYSPLTPYVLGRNRVAGAEVIDVHPELARYFEVDGGVLVVDVPAGTPAAAADLRPGDVIVALDGSAVGSIRDLRRGVARAGSAVPVQIIRHGEHIRLFLPR